MLGLHIGSNHCQLLEHLYVHASTLDVCVSWCVCVCVCVCVRERERERERDRERERERERD